MKNPKSKLPIGILDSGIGGISVLADIIKILPYEKFIYFADTLNCPYGNKPENVVKSLTIRAVEILSLAGIKSLVIACNTATSAAINEVRRMFNFPVIGMEPAVKPAIELGLKGKILIMATPLTLKSKKFNMSVCQHQHLAEIVSLPCEELVEIIERGYTQGREIEDSLSRSLSPLRKENFAAIVLGCTHFVLIKKEIEKMAGKEIVVIDGNCGTANNLKTILQKENLLRYNTDEGKPQIPLKAHIKFYITANESEVMTKYTQLLQNEGIVCV